MEQGLVRLPLTAEGLSVGREVLLAEPITVNREYRIRSIPAFIYGVGLGDTVEIIDSKSGRFRVLVRGGQVTVRVFVNGSLDRPDVQSLVSAIVTEGGSYEVGKNDQAQGGTSLLLVSLDASIGFGKIEKLMTLVEGPDVQWEYGNVYDRDGSSLNWWLH
jgi:hypothetical protein